MFFGAKKSNLGCRYKVDEIFLLDIIRKMTIWDIPSAYSVSVTMRTIDEG